MRRSSAIVWIGLLTVLLCLIPWRSAAQSAIGVIAGAGEMMAVNPRTNRLYVNNSGGGSIIAIDGYTHVASNLVMPGGSFPQGIAINPISNRLYVQSGGGTIQVLDGDSHAIVNSFSGAGAVAFNLNTGRIYVPTGGALRVLATDESEIAVVGVAGTIVAVDPLANQIFVADSSGEDVHVIDGLTHAVQSLEVFGTPAVLAINPQTRKLYVACFSADKVVEVDAITLAVQDIAVAERPTALLVDPVLNKIYVGHNPSGASPANVTVIDGATRATSPIAVGIRPASLAFDAGTRKVFVSNHLSGNVSVIDADTQTLQTTISWGGGVQASHLAVNPVTHRIYVQSPFSAGLAVIDGASLDVVTHSAGLSASFVVFDRIQRRLVTGNFSDTLQLVHLTTGAATPFTPVPGAAIHHLAFDAGNNRIVARHGDGRLSLIDGDDLSVRTSTVISTGVVGMAIDPARDRIFLVDSVADNVRVVSGADFSVVPVAVGDSPGPITLDVVSGTAWVGNAGTSNSITRIDGNTLATVSAAPSAQPVSLVFDASTNRLFVSLLNTARIAVMNGNTLASSEINLVAAAQALAFNPRRGLVLIGHTGFETRLSLLNASTLAAPTTINVSGATNRILVDPVNDRSHVFTTDSMLNRRLISIRGPGNAMVTRTLSTLAQSPVFDPLNGQVYFDNGSDLLRLNTERDANTLNTVASAAGGHNTSTGTATLNFVASSTATPTPSAPLAMFWRKGYEPWSAATAGAPGSFSATANLTLGSHDIQAFALDAFGAVTQSAMGTASVAINQPMGSTSGRLAGLSLTRIVPTSIPTSTSIGAITPTISVVGQAYSVPVTVSGGGAPTGTVQVSDGAGSSCQITLSAGSGSCDLSSDESGAHTISANYLGEGLFEPSSGSVAHQVDPAATSTSILADSPDPSTPNQSVQVSVSVSALAPGAGSASGQVAVLVTPGGATCNANLLDGTGACSVAITGNGNYQISASYPGDGNFAASASSDAPHLVEDGADLSIAISDGQAQMIAGTQTNYTVTVANAGPELALNARVRTFFAPTMTIGAWSCTAAAGASCVAGQASGTPANGNGAINQFVDLPVGGTLSLSLAATLSSAQIADILSVVDISSPRGDANPTNNVAADSNAVQRVANLSVTKSNLCWYVPAGGLTVYRITVNNSGPSDAVGTRVQDAPTGILSGDSWSCAAFNGASCASGGLGNLDQFIDLPVGSNVLIGVFTTVGNAPPNTVSNTVTITPAVGVEDSTPTNNMATDTDLVAMFGSGFETECPPF